MQGYTRNKDILSFIILSTARITQYQATHKLNLELIIENMQLEKQQFVVTVQVLGIKWPLIVTHEHTTLCEILSLDFTHSPSEAVAWHP